MVLCCLKESEVMCSIIDMETKAKSDGKESWRVWRLMEEEMGIRWKSVA